MVANMTSNYGEGLGNISSVQKIYKDGMVYSMRSRESLKNAIMTQSGLYDNLKTTAGDSVAQKLVNDNENVATNPALEGGYMSTVDTTYIRKSSFYLTDAISCDSFVLEPRFHNNLHLAMTNAKEKNFRLQDSAKEAGLMPYQYEYEKSLKIYSMTIDLSMIGKDENFNAEADNDEKARRVNALLTAVENLSLVVKGNLDNSEPIFAVGGFSERKTHFFENVVRVKGGNLVISNDLINKVKKGFNVAMLEGKTFKNEDEIKSSFENIMSISEFFDELREEVVKYYK